MPMASMSAPSRSDWDRNAYHVRKGVVLMFRIHLQITSRALSSGGDAAYLPARPHRKKKRQPAAALVEAARSLALETGCRVGDVDRCRQPRRGPSSTGQR